VRLKKNQYGQLIRYSLHKDIPVFYWFQYLDKNEIEDVLRKTMTEIKDVFKQFRILHVSAWFGRSFFNEILSPMKKKVDFSRFPKASKYQSLGAGVYFQYDQIEMQKKGASDKKYKELLEKKLSELLQNRVEGIPNYIEDIWNLDYYIYGSTKN